MAEGGGEVDWPAEPVDDGVATGELETAAEPEAIGAPGEAGVRHSRTIATTTAATRARMTGRPTDLDCPEPATSAILADRRSTLDEPWGTFGAAFRYLGLGLRVTARCHDPP